MGITKKEMVMDQAKSVINTLLTTDSYAIQVMAINKLKSMGFTTENLKYIVSLKSKSIA